MQSKTFTVPNIGCAGCVRTIENELKEVKGVANVKAAIEGKTVVVNWDAPATWDTIKGKLVEIDYAPAEPLMP